MKQDAQAFALAIVLCSGSASADVVVLANYETGAIVIRGNLPDGSEADEAVQEAKSQRETGWTSLFADDEKGWGAVMCVRHKEGVFFAEANGKKSKGEALQVAKVKADRFIKEQGEGIFIPLCAPAWNNDGQKIAFGGDGVPEWQEQPQHKDSGVVDFAKGQIRKGVREDNEAQFKRDCVRPEPAPSAGATLKPIGTGAAPLQDTQPKKAAEEWRPAPWCPRPGGNGGVRG